MSDVGFQVLAPASNLEVGAGGCGCRPCLFLNWKQLGKSLLVNLVQQMFELSW